MNGHVKSGHLSKDFCPTARIETQIHRRRKVKIFSPLLIEWEGFHPSGTELSHVDRHIDRSPTPMLESELSKVTDSRTSSRLPSAFHR